MLLSEMFGVERGEAFEIKGCADKLMVIVDDFYTEHLRVQGYGKGEWIDASTYAIYQVIKNAPSGIIHLPPPLTDEQREQLRALWTLGYRWLVKDKYGSVYAYETKPYTKYRDMWHCKDGGLYLCCAKPTKCLEPLVSWSDPEPYDIGKALNIKN